MSPFTGSNKSPGLGNVGSKLRDLRKSRNLTQSDLAARIGIQQSDLCRMENGRNRATLAPPGRDFDPRGSTGVIPAPAEPPPPALIRRKPGREID